MNRGEHIALLHRVSEVAGVTENEYVEVAVNATRRNGNNATVIMVIFSSDTPPRHLTSYPCEEYI